MAETVTKGGRQRHEDWGNAENTLRAEKKNFPISMQFYMQQLWLLTLQELLLLLVFLVLLLCKSLEKLMQICAYNFARHFSVESKVAKRTRKSHNAAQGKTWSMLPILSVFK